MKVALAWRTGCQGTLLESKFVRKKAVSKRSTLTRRPSSFLPMRQGLLLEACEIVKPLAQIVVESGCSAHLSMSAARLELG